MDQHSLWDKEHLKLTGALPGESLLLNVLVEHLLLDLVVAVGHVDEKVDGGKNTDEGDGHLGDLLPLLHGGLVVSLVGVCGEATASHAGHGVASSRNAGGSREETGRHFPGLGV